MRSPAANSVPLFLLLLCYSSVGAFAPPSSINKNPSPLIAAAAAAAAVDARSPTLTSAVHIPSTSRPFSLRRLFLKSLQEQEDSYLEMAASNPNQPEIVYILMYNPGTDQEGVHTTEFPKDSEAAEVILGFEELGDCIQFASALKGNPNFPLEPVPTPTPLQQMQSAVESMGLSIMVVPSSASN
jgi:hypothetical protein